MRFIRRRKQIRDLVRKAKGQVKGAPTPVPAAHALQEFFCRCGKILKLNSKEIHQVLSCPACGRKITIAREGGPGMEILHPVFQEESNPAELEGQLLADTNVGSEPAHVDPQCATAIVATVHAQAVPGESDPAIVPAPPDQIHFYCPGCRAKLAANRSLYDRRGRCSECDSRLLINLVFDRAAKHFDVRLVRLGDSSTGLTEILPSV